MSVEVVTVKDFDRIARENEYFFWHFTTPQNSSLTLQPYNSDRGFLPHPIRTIVDWLKIPYFESQVVESVDFICNLKNGYSKAIYGPNKGVYNPVILGFKRKNLLHGTWDGFCYCDEGFINLIYATNPKFFENVEIGD